MYGCLLPALRLVPSPADDQPARQPGLVAAHEAGGPDGFMGILLPLMHPQTPVGRSSMVSFAGSADAGGVTRL